MLFCSFIVTKTLRLSYRLYVYKYLYMHLVDLIFIISSLFQTLKYQNHGISVSKLTSGVRPAFKGCKESESCHCYMLDFEFYVKH